MFELATTSDDSGKAFMTNPKELTEFIQCDESHMLNLENWE